MGNFVNLIFSAIFGLSTLLPHTPDQNMQNSNAIVPGNVCVNDFVLKNGINPGIARVPERLFQINKASRDNTSAGYEIPECQNKGGCDGPPQSDYVLIATNIKETHTVYPNSFVEGASPSDRQLVKQIDTTSDPILSDRYKNRIYRTYCGDWCYTCKPEDVICVDPECLTEECDTQNPPVELPFRGSYHCDFIFYLQETDPNGNPQIDQNGNIAPALQNALDPSIPKDGAFFSVYFRQDASFPAGVTCDKTDQLPKITPLHPNPAAILDQRLEYPPGTSISWLLQKNPVTTDGLYMARNSQIINFNSKRGILDNPLNLGGSYDVYDDLLDPEGSNYLYLTPRGKVDEVEADINSSPPKFSLFPYYLLIRWDAYEGNQKSLKLGSFPLQADWITKWVTESKPAIYLYPEKETEVTVKLKPRGYLTVSDPPYDTDEGWRVFVKPDGWLSVISNQLSVNKNQPTTNNQQLITEYPYLYYEAQLSQVPNPKEGFIMERSNIKGQISKILEDYGLNEKEIADYMEYWLPRLEVTDRDYFLVYFLTAEEINYIEPLSISIPVETEIRVRTYFKPLEKPIEMARQVLPKTKDQRHGNTIIEWGGILDE